jgi:hypothetical protein
MKGKYEITGQNFDVVTGEKLSHYCSSAMAKAETTKKK